MTAVSAEGPRDYVGYVRVSKVHDRDTEGKKDRYHSPDMQLEAIKRTIESAGDSYVDYHFDPDKSGFQNITREGWDAAIAWCMEDPHKRGIVAYDTSRLSRNLWKLLGDVQHTLVPGGARVIVAGENVDTAKDGWELGFQIAGMMAEQFSLKVGRAWRGVHQRRLDKKQSPVGKVPYGYKRLDPLIDPSTGDLVPRQGIEPDPTTAPTMRRLYDLYLDGQGLRAICETLNSEIKRAQAHNWNALHEELSYGFSDSESLPVVTSPGGTTWAVSTVRRLLDHGSAAGYLRFKGALQEGRVEDGKEGGWEPLIDRETWQAHLRAAERRRRVPNRSQTSGWTLAGIAVCAKCGGRLTVNNLTSPGGAAMCSLYRTRGKSVCTGVFIKRSMLETKFTYYLGTVLETVGREATSQAGQERDALRRAAQYQGAEAQAMLERLSSARVIYLERHGMGEIDASEYRDLMKRNAEETQKHRDLLEAANNAAVGTEPLDEVWEQLESAGAGMSPQAWNLVLRRVVKRVEVGDKLLFVPVVGDPVSWGRASGAGAEAK